MPSLSRSWQGVPVWASRKHTTFLKSLCLRWQVHRLLVLNRIWRVIWRRRSLRCQGMTAQHSAFYAQSPIFHLHHRYNKSDVVKDTRGVYAALASSGFPSLSPSPADSPWLAILTVASKPQNPQPRPPPPLLQQRLYWGCPAPVRTRRPPPAKRRAILRVTLHLRKPSFSHGCLSLSVQSCLGLRSSKMKPLRSQ